MILHLIKYNSNSSSKIKIKKTKTTLEPFFDRRSFKDDIETKVYFENDGKETTGRQASRRPS